MAYNSDEHAVYVFEQIDVVVSAVVIVGGGVSDDFVVQLLPFRGDQDIDIVIVHLFGVRRDALIL